MGTININISRHQKILDIMKFLPSDALVWKTITACGATHAEIHCKRNSLIAEANVPVIIGKVEKAAKDGQIILGVYEKTTLKDILNYLTSDVEFKKILTTPEAYLTKVKPAFEQLKINPYTDYYFLYDESEKTIQDVNYRFSIIEPLDDFFRYINKGFISATPIMPSDPRFVKNNFNQYVIVPDYDFREPFTLHITNNIILSVRDYIANNKTDHYSFFMNSTDGINHLIKFLDIAAESQVFCAKKSQKKLKSDGFANAFTELQPLKKYNFYTSRFFSAVDIEVDVKPDVVIISDLHFVEHTMIDPATEAVQIMGRFRNGNNKITHITNINANIKYQTRVAVQQYLDGSYESYNTIYTLYILAGNPTQKGAYKDALEKMTYFNYVDKYYRRSYFLIDNKLDEEMVKGYYSSKEKLCEAYGKVPNFKLSVTYSEYPLSDEQRFKRTYPKDNPELFETVIEQMEHLHKKEFPYQLDNRQSEINSLIDEFPELTKAYYRLGSEAIAKAGYKLKKVKSLMEQIVKKDTPMAFPAIVDFNKTFFKEGYYPCSELETVIATLKAKYKITERPLSLLRRMFDVSERIKRSQNGRRVWMRYISNPKFIIE